MSHHAGNCPVCKKVFLDEDDVVICPSCGAPYHRACFQQAGQCLFTEKHGAGFEYRDKASGGGSAAKEVPGGSMADEQRTDGGVLCQACGTANDARNIFCEKCGTPLHGKSPFGQGAAPNGAGQPPPAGQRYAYGQPPFGMGGGVYADLSGQIDGIPKQDWALHIGNAAPTYIYRLSQMQQRKSKVSFMPSAFFLGPFYFAYRKMWGWAALALVLSLLLSAPLFLFIAAEMGTPLIPGLSVEFWDIVSTISSYVSLGVNLLTGLFALYLFRIGTAKRMRALREKHGETPAYQESLAHAGGPSVLGVVLVVVITFAFSVFWSFYIGNDLVNFLLPYM